MSAIRQRSHTSPPGRAVLVALLAASVLIRVLYFQELSRGPCIWQHRWSETDMYFFDRWARSIAAGDWLTERPLHPHTIWQRPIAEAYLAERPQGATAVMDEGPAGDPSLQPWEMVWDHWYGGRCFHQEPLYPYLVALTYRALGPDVRWVFVWQMAIGVLTNVLVYEIARRHFGERVGRLAGLLAVLCGPMLFYETILLRETLITFAGVALVFLVDRAAERGRWRSWLLAGVAFGLALLLRTTFLLMLAGVLAWMAWGTRPANAVGPRARARNAAALACGAALCLLPAVARNVAVGAPAACLSGVGPITFLAANAEDYPTDRGFWVSRHTAEIMVKADGRLLPVVVETLRTHPGPASYLRQLAAKFGAVWHWYEKPNNENFYYYRLHASVLRFLPVTFLLIAPLSAVGLVLAARRLRQHAALYLLVVTTVAQLLLFYVISRPPLPPRWLAWWSLPAGPRTPCRGI